MLDNFNTNGDCLEYFKMDRQRGAAEIFALINYPVYMINKPQFFRVKGVKSKILDWFWTVVHRLISPPFPSHKTIISRAKLPNIKLSINFSITSLQIGMTYGNSLPVFFEVQYASRSQTHYPPHYLSWSNRCMHVGIGISANPNRNS